MDHRFLYNWVNWKIILVGWLWASCCSCSRGKIDWEFFRPSRELIFVFKSISSLLLVTRIKNNRKWGGVAAIIIVVYIQCYYLLLSVRCLMKSHIDIYFKSGFIGGKNLHERHTHPWSQGSRVSFVSTVTLSRVKKEKNLISSWANSLELSQI